MPHDGATAWLQQRTARPVCGNRCWVPFTQQASYGAATASHAPLLKSHQGGCTQNTAGNADRLMSQISSHACCYGVCCFLQQQRFSPHAVQVMLAWKAAALLVQQATAILCAGCNCRNPCPASHRQPFRATAAAAQAPRSRSSCWLLPRWRPGCRPAAAPGPALLLGLHVRLWPGQSG